MWDGSRAGPEGAVDDYGADDALEWIRGAFDSTEHRFLVTEGERVLLYNPDLPRGTSDPGAEDAEDPAELTAATEQQGD